MRPNPRARKAVAFACIALVVLAAIVPATAALIVAVLTPLWLVVPAVLVSIVRRRAARSDAQPIALLSLALFRAPPHISALA